MADLKLNSLLRKTESGVLAIKERDRSLAPRARTLLIMMDGAKTAVQLAAINGDLDQGMALLGQLVETGFASVLAAEVRAGGSLPAAPSQALSAAPGPAEPAPTSTAAAAPSQSPARDLTASIRAATRFLEGMMGPGADTFNIQIERCKSVPEFEAKVQEITLLLARARSVKKAEEFNAVALGK